MVSATPRPRFTPGNRIPGTHWIGIWVASELVSKQARGKKKSFASAGDRTPVKSVVRHCADWATPAPRPQGAVSQEAGILAEGLFWSRVFGLFVGICTCARSVAGQGLAILQARFGLKVKTGGTKGQKATLSYSVKKYIFWLYFYLTFLVLF
jgi:hypothetical protein